MGDSRKKLIKQLMEIRSNWTLQDFIDAYEDEWDEIPKTIEECKTDMEDHISYTYDTSLIKECIHDENF